MNLHALDRAAKAPGNAPPAGATAASLEVRVITSAAEFDGLREAWSELLDDSDAGIFQTFEWQRTWWKHLGEASPDRTLHLVVLAAAGRLVAIAPLFLERVPIGPLVALRRLAFVGTGLTDYLDVIVRRGLEATACERLAAHLAASHRSFEVLYLADLPDRSPSRTLLFEALQRQGFEGTLFVSERCPRLALRSTWNETLQGIKGDRRRNVLRKIRHLEQGFRVELEVCERRETLDGDVEDFIALHQARWTGVGKAGVFAQARAAAFQRDVSRALFARGWLVLAFLRVDGNRLAASCSFRFRDVLSYYLGGMARFGPTRGFAPGLVLQAKCIERANGEGVRVYDFLRGTEPYKYELGGVDVPNWTMVMFGRGSRLPRAKQVVALLEESVARRWEQEKAAFDHQRRAHGWFSEPTARYLWKRLQTTIRDGRTKLRAPEKSLAASREAAGGEAAGAE